MSGLGKVELSGSRYVTGHVGRGPDHAQTRIRALYYGTKFWIRASLNTKQPRFLASAYGMLSDFVATAVLLGVAERATIAWLSRTGGASLNWKASTLSSSERTSAILV